MTYALFMNKSFTKNQTFILILFLLQITWSLKAMSDVTQLKTQLATSPDNLKLRYELAKDYFDQNQFQKASETLMEKSEALNQDSLVLLITSFQKLNDSVHELKFLEQLTASYPKFPQGFVLLGDFHFRKSQEKNDPRNSMNSLAAYKAAIEINPLHRPAYDGLLKAYEKYKNYYELRILLEDMTKRFGKSAEILSHLCRRHTIDGYFVTGRKSCLEAISLDGNIPDNYVYLSLIENNEGNIAKAEGLLKKATTQFPQSEFAASNFADFLIQQKNLPSAETFYKAAATVNKKSFRAQIGLGKVAFELKHYDSALEAYKLACELNPFLSIKSLKRATDLLRHRREEKYEDRFSALMGKCITTSNDTRAPASVPTEEYRSPFALYSRNKIIDN